MSLCTLLCVYSCISCMYCVSVCNTHAHTYICAILVYNNMHSLLLLLLYVYVYAYTYIHIHIIHLQVGQIVNYMQLDTARMEYVAGSIHTVWDGLLQVRTYALQLLLTPIYASVCMLLACCFRTYTIHVYCHLL